MGYMPHATYTSDPAPPTCAHSLHPRLYHPNVQVDLIVCYDATSSPTRSIQRMGRTGRHKEGRVVYLLAAGREADKYAKIEEVGTTRRGRQGPDEGRRQRRDGAGGWREAT